MLILAVIVLAFNRPLPFYMVTVSKVFSAVNVVSKSVGFALCSVLYPSSVLF